MITTGVTGNPWRASITEFGGVLPWDGKPLNWFVAADDRWHVPADEAAVRQHRVEGTPVTETRVRVPNGDVVQRIYSCADGGGLTVVEVENESTLPVAVAFDRRDVLTERPIADVRIEGIELGPEAFVMPLGHKATLRVGIAHHTPRGGPLPPDLPSSTQVVRGWLSLVERASRLLVPDGELGGAVATRVVSERCELALGGIARADDDPAAFAVGLGELVRLGERPEEWLPELVTAVERLGPQTSWAADAGLAAAASVLAVAGERRALGDIERIRLRRDTAPRPERAPDEVLCIPWLEARLVDGGALLPNGIPSGWLGQAIEVYGVPAGPGTAVSFAVRWHGSRPAVLWEQQGTPITLTAPAVAPGWRTSDRAGEALWPEPEISFG